MTAPTIITCGDLAALGTPWRKLWQHDPERMIPGADALCHCHNVPPETTDPVACEALLPVPLTEGLTLRVCCLCAPYFADVLRDGDAAERLHYWLLGQVADALRWRDRRRLDSSPVPCDMDVEAAGVLDRTEGDET